MSNNHQEGYSKVVSLLLESIINKKPYPGQETQFFIFPDIHRIARLDEIIITSQNIDELRNVFIPGRKVLVLSSGEITDKANQTGPFPFFSIMPIEISSEEMTLSIQLSAAKKTDYSSDNVLELYGGGVTIKLIKDNNNWIAPEGPTTTWMT